jgi:hypothetical protein
MKMTIRLPALTAALAVAMVVAARADEVNPKTVWGGGPAASSAYTANYVPKVIEILEAQHLSGYAWGGVSQGTIANAEMVTDHPTNLAVGQSDLFALIKDQSFPGARARNTSSLS